MTGKDQKGGVGMTGQEDMPLGLTGTALEEWIAQKYRSNPANTHIPTESELNRSWEKRGVLGPQHPDNQPPRSDGAPDDQAAHARRLEREGLRSSYAPVAGHGEAEPENDPGRDR